MAWKKRCESIKTTQSKTKASGEGEKNKDGVKKKSVFLGGAARWGSLLVHILL